MLDDLAGIVNEPDLWRGWGWFGREQAVTPDIHSLFGAKTAITVKQTFATPLSIFPRPLR